MITALFAMGPNGEMSFEGKLPWKDYKLELEVFYASLKALAPRVILMGSTTYLDLPPKVLERICKAPGLKTDAGTDALAAIHVVGSKKLGECFEKSKEVPFLAITQIGENFKNFYANENTVCIGGARLLDTLVQANAIQDFRVSTVFPNDGSTMLADTYIPKRLVDLKTTKILLNQTVNQEEKYNHIQEVWVL